MIHWWSQGEELKSYRKGSETWGTPFDTTNWFPITSIQDWKASENSWNINPNPATDFVTIEVSVPGMNPRNLIIYTIQGVKVDELTFNTEKFTFPAGKYDDGIYLLKLFAGNQLIGVKKLIIQ
jgi:hypothetical protein